MNALAALWLVAGGATKRWMARIAAVVRAVLPQPLRVVACARGRLAGGRAGAPG